MDMSRINSQRLAIREPPAVGGAVVARQGPRSRQARPGRHPATASPLHLACWNVRSLGVTSSLDSFHPRKSAVIDLELLRLGVDVSALGETWLTGNGSIREANFTFYWTGYPDLERPKHGVGFAICNKLLSFVETPVAISPRLMSLQLHTTSGPVSLLSAYAPTLTSPDDQKDAFYLQLSETLSKIDRGHRIIILGDLNARVGSNTNAWPDVLGPHGVGSMNENGQRLLELCATHRLCIPSTFFKGSPWSKMTWQHPRSKRWHQLDHVITQKKHLQDIIHCRTMHSADCDTDHSLVRCKLKLKPKKIHLSCSKPLSTLNVLATKSKEKCQHFQASIQSTFVQSAPPQDAASAWLRIRDTVGVCALSSFGRRTVKQPDWFRHHADTLHQALAEKRAARLAVMQDPSPQATSLWKQSRSKVQRLTREAKHNYWSDISKRAEDCSATGNTGGMYQALKEALGPPVKKSSPLRSLTGELLTNPDDQLDRWVEHYSSLYAQPVAASEAAIIAAVPQLPVLHELDYDITIDEVHKTIKLLRNNKAPGVDGLPSEIFRCGGDSLTEELHHLFSICWNEGTIPDELRNANIVTLYKNKGFRCDCNNYRGISLLSQPGKIYARLVLPRLQIIANRILPESQCGFRPGRSTTDMIFSVRQIQEKCIEQGRPLYAVFVDLTKAFDYVSRSGLFLVLRLLGCPPKLLKTIQEFHDQMKATVQFEGSRSKEFPISCGVKQGCVLAPTLFGIYFSAVLRRAFPNPTGVLLHTRSTGGLFNLARLRSKTMVNRVQIRELLYADDAAFIANSEVELQAMCSSFASACEEFGLKISLGKTVVFAQPAGLSPIITVNNHVLSNVTKFTYLGSTVDNTNSLDCELDSRIGKASTTFGRLSERVWKNKSLSLHLKIKVYEACILSTLLYGSETWCTYRRHEHRLNAFHFRCLRTILGFTWKDHVPNTAILSTTKSTDMYTVLRIRRLRWAGHTCRMDDSRLPKALLFGEIADAPRCAGRPRLRYKDVLKRDLQVFGIPHNTWETSAGNRAKWQAAIRSGAKRSCQQYTDFLNCRRLKRLANRRPRR